MKKMLLLAALLGLSGIASAKDIAFDTAFKNEAKAYKGCDVPKDAAKSAYSADSKSLLLVLAFEGCGGGNNWGQQVILFKDFDGKKWQSRKEIKDINNVETVQFKDGNFVLNYSEYGNDDPRCCPSIKKTAKISAN